MHLTTFLTIQSHVTGAAEFFGERKITANLTRLLGSDISRLSHKPRLVPRAVVGSTVTASMRFARTIWKLATDLLVSVMEMFSTRWKQHQILDAVVAPDAVNVMDNFHSCKQSAKVFFHNEPMLQNSSNAINEWMIRHFYYYVPSRSRASFFVAWNNLRMQFSPFEIASLAPHPFPRRIISFTTAITAILHVVSCPVIRYGYKSIFAL